MLCRCHGSCGCSPCCRWSSPQHVLRIELLLPSFVLRSLRRPPSWTPGEACSWHLRSGDKQLSLVFGVGQRSDLNMCSSLTCAHSGQLWRPIGSWWWSRRRCDGCCSTGWPATATCPALPPPPRLSGATLLSFHSLDRDPFSYQKDWQRLWSSVTFL